MEHNIEISISGDAGLNKVEVRIELSEKVSSSSFLGSCFIVKSS